MAKLFPKLKKNDKNAWLYLVLSIILIIGAVIVMPIWDGTGVFWGPYGEVVVRIILCILLALYIFGFLMKKVLNHGNNTIKVLTILEFALMFVLDLGLILPIFGISIPSVTEPCKLIGIAMWVRGVIEIFRAYYHQRSSSEKYPVSWLVISICFVTFGTYLYLRSIISVVQLQWILFGVLVATGLALLVCAIYGWPKKK